MKTLSAYLPIAACLACLAVGATILKYRIHHHHDYKYNQVHILNTQYKAEHKEACIPYPVEDHDWEETAHALGLPVDSLTITAYLEHISK